MTRLAEWSVSRWFNSREPLTLAGLRGKVVLIHAFQMLCPGCVVKATPQAQRVFEIFRGSRLQVVGLHTVFEHHAAMNEGALEAFIHEFKVTFPVGVDRPGRGSLPETMERYALRGTPSTLLVDAEGNLRRHLFGIHDDLLLGAEIGGLLAEAEVGASSAATAGVAQGSCAVGDGCRPIVGE
ncbi:TlpA disulfide reductase family protein [Sorangium cellulosum]|uniref:Alkyl hydroperoxide reductase n=1 Tax=Sorangium cellulosum TaxID=56 RepID=A0A150PYD7_SORCE|nr:TlpA disulfide reductase family protein [Sorangium cellulosum]KYF60553.1 alkyl hydroperoxide reductase [Sorangium cellulosum]